MRGPTVACAVVRDAPPILMLAEDLDVLQRALALRLVALTRSARHRWHIHHDHLAVPHKRDGAS